MELASYLAGERWSDHPACTHPLLAEVARMVNDYTADQARARLAVLIPSVIGLNGDDPRIEARIVLRAATTALPVVAAERQRAMAVSVLAAEQYLAELDGRPVGELEERSRWALEQAPHRDDRDQDPAVPPGRAGDRALGDRRDRVRLHPRPRHPPVRPARRGDRRLCRGHQATRRPGVG
jgi:hypothetical protein